MAHVALVDENGIVRDVHVLRNEDLPNNGAFTPEVESAAQKLQADLGLAVNGSVWRLTSYNGNFRGRFAGIGFRYDVELDEFMQDAN